MIHTSAGRQGNWLQSLWFPNLPAISDPRHAPDVKTADSPALLALVPARSVEGYMILTLSLLVAYVKRVLEILYTLNVSIP